MEKQGLLNRTLAGAKAVGIPQPWDLNDTTRESHLADAETKEKSGSRLVVETWVNGYADPMCEGDLWFVDWLDYSDARTGERIGGYSPFDEEPGEELANLLVVERGMVND